MPRRVDGSERRRTIAEAVFRVIGRGGSEGVSLRDVAVEAGVSMGMVQHYFRSKDEMLLFALDHMNERVAARFRRRLGPAALDAPPKAVLRAAISAMLPLDEESRQEACVSLAFVSRATVLPAYAEAIRTGYDRLIAVAAGHLARAAEAGELAPHVDVEEEAAALMWTTQGLLGPMLLGHYTADEGLSYVDSYLDRIIPPA